MQTINTKQIAFWQGEFGKNYTKRNIYNNRQLNSLYKKRYKKTRIEMNELFLSHIDKKIRILEVGCNVGQQLRLLQQQGFSNLYGIEIQWNAVEIAKKKTKNINIIQASAFDIPFKDNYFDLVFTSGVLIHISPKDIEKAIHEIYRVSNTYIWGFEYYSKNKYEEVTYRGNKNTLWKTDFKTLYQNKFPQLKLLKETFYPNVGNEDLVDHMFLLNK